MRTTLLALLFVSCVPQPSEPKPTELQLPAEHATDVPLTTYVRADGTWDTEIDYALGDGYPTSLTITPPSSVYVIQGCSKPQGTATWGRISTIEGSGATVALESGVVSVTLVAEGTMNEALAGSASDLDCSGVTTLPLEQRLTIRVRRVSGFLVDQLHQGWPGCEQQVVLPAGVEAWIPVAHPLDANGQRFKAANAPRPVAITIESTGALTRGSESWKLTGAPGHVTLRLHTDKPVQGLEGFDVVGPDTLTEVDAKLVLRKAAAKGSVVEELTDGASYLLWYPEQENLVDLAVNAATSTAGQLCMPIPSAWVAASSSTPAQCGPTSGELYGGGLPVAKIQSLGECKLEVTIPNTSHRLATAFSTR